MTITVLLGTQWGDEGKGRIVDALASSADIVARSNGGDNAGHSITIGERVVKLHLVPSGIFRAHCLNVIGNGVVLNPRNLLKEMAEIRAAGVPVDPTRLRISQAAHVILPGHVALDGAREATKGGIGTTAAWHRLCLYGQGRAHWVARRTDGGSGALRRRGASAYRKRQSNPGQ